MPTEQQILSEEQIAEIEARANAATKGPWEPRDVSPFGNEILIDTIYDGLRGAIARVINPARFMSSMKQQEEKDAQTRANALFIQYARGDIPALCQTVRALLQEQREGEMCEFCDEMSNLPDGSPRTFLVCGACWNENVEANRVTITGLRDEAAALQSRLSEVTRERDDLLDKLAEEVAKRVNKSVASMEDDRLTDTQRGSFD